MSIDDYESRITNLFVSVMDIVRMRRHLRRKEDALLRDIDRADVDKRILAVLDNEYERSLEEPGYKMRPVFGYERIYGALIMARKPSSGIRRTHDPRHHRRHSDPAEAGSEV